MRLLREKLIMIKVFAEKYNNYAYQLHFRSLIRYVHSWEGLVWLKINFHWLHINYRLIFLSRLLIYYLLFHWNRLLAFTLSWIDQNIRTRWLINTKNLQTIEIIIWVSKTLIQSRIEITSLYYVDLVKMKHWIICFAHYKLEKFGFNQLKSQAKIIRFSIPIWDPQYFKFLVSKKNINF